MSHFPRHRTPQSIGRSAATLLGIVAALILPGVVFGFDAADIEQATFKNGLPPGKSALTAKVQILLDRAGISPGVVDGFNGGMSESALRAFQRRTGLRDTGRLDAQTWDVLLAYAQKPVTQDYTITPADTADLVPEIPRDYALQAQMGHLGYTSVAEKLGERFHMDEKFIAYLNPGTPLVPGQTIKVMQPAPRISGTVTRILVHKGTRRVSAYDAKGALIADYPATIGSDAMPSPSGTHLVEAVASNPTYHYNPYINKQQGKNDRPLTLPPGPNNPVGSTWIDLSKPTYGIHGTRTPSQLFVNSSSGCVRLTNWDVAELGRMVKPGVTVVDFLDRNGRKTPDMPVPAGGAPASGTGTDPVTTAPPAAGQVAPALTFAPVTGPAGGIEAPKPRPRPALRRPLPDGQKPSLTPPAVIAPAAPMGTQAGKETGIKPDKDALHDALTEAMTPPLTEPSTKAPPPSEPSPPSRKGR